MTIFSYIKTKINIFDVVSEYTNLKKAGNYWKGHCPFHNEKTASFTVSPHKEIFYCFGCHAGGDVITFISKVENYSQIEAAQHLAKTYQIDLPKQLAGNIIGSTENKEKYFDICKKVSDWCHDQLIKSPYVIKYLLDRGFSKQTINSFKIGYFPGGLRSSKSLLNYMNKHSYIQDDLLETKILSEGKKFIYSPFEERIIFPIKDIIGRFCGFGGRIFKENDERVKYYNSHENLYFNKGSLLFGFDLAKKKIKEKDYIFIVEGYTDCIAMAQYGFENTVATLGTACTQEHLKILSRYVSYVYILYDGDKAGQKAIIRLTELCWQVDIELKVIKLPENDDPASFLEKGEDLNKLIDKSNDIFVFFIETIGNNFLSKTLSQKLKLSKNIVKTINNIKDPIKRDILRQKAAKSMQITIDSIKDQNELPPVSPKTACKQQDIEHKLEKNIFFAIISNMELINDDNEEFLAIYLPNPLKDIFTKLKLARNKVKHLDFVSFFDTLDDNERKYVSKLLLEFDGKIEENTFDKLFLQFQKKHWKYIVKRIKENLEIAKSKSDENKIELILQKFCELKRKLLDTKI